MTSIQWDRLIKIGYLVYLCLLPIALKHLITTRAEYDPNIPYRDETLEATDWCRHAAFVVLVIISTVYVFILG